MRRGRAGRNARQAAPRGQTDALRRPLARPRSGRSAAGRQARHPHARRQEGETIVHDIVQGEVLRQRGSRRHDPAALRRHADLHARRRRRRSRHGRDAHHSRRRSSEQRRAADSDHQAMGWAVPVYGHLPLIHGPDGAKLSKRHGALGVDAYREMGYLPDAMRNYLARLGWSHGDEEIFSTEQPIAGSTSPTSAAPARFDFAKLDNVNGHYMRAASDDATLRGADRRPALSQWRPGGRGQTRRAEPAELRAAIPGSKERAKTLVELLDGAGFLFATRPLEMDAKAEEILPAPYAPSQEPAAAPVGADRLDGGERGGSRARLRRRGRRELGIVAQPLRAALTGRSTSPGIFDVLTVLGREESLGRIADQAEQISDPRQVASLDLVVCPCSSARPASSSTSPQSPGLEKRVLVRRE